MTVLFPNGITNPMLPTAHRPLHGEALVRLTHGSIPRALVAPLPAMITSLLANITDTLGTLALARDSTTLLHIPRRCITT